MGRRIAKQLAQNLAQLVGRQPPPHLPAFKHRDDPGLFAHHHQHGVGLLGQPQRRAVPAAERLVEPLGLGQRKLHPGRRDAPARNDHPHVVQRRAGPENGVQERRRQLRVHPRARFDHRPQLRRALERHQRADLVPRQILDRLGHRVDCPLQVAGQVPEPARRPQPNQRPPQLGLKRHQRHQQHAHQERRIEHLDPLELELVGHGVHHQRRRQQNHRHAAKEALAARAAQKAHHRVHHERDQRQFQQRREQTPIQMDQTVQQRSHRLHARLAGCPTSPVVSAIL
ncbi:MAG: hypothetical protein U1A27_07685 [Phycisphaerae bacterium]